ncbi:hypothetical protein PIB30_080091 [Stylosanthes scabra]|uniref:Uncharacterized protein n=1 Tax=Stylosanthes scabra TaxID=79078 RepID=A0ABU6YS26_9FABA|nr:hypothetical protein [Stylosanthes scabra]
MGAGTGPFVVLHDEGAALGLASASALGRGTGSPETLYNQGWAPHILIPNTQHSTILSPLFFLPNIFVMDQPQPLVGRIPAGLSVATTPVRIAKPPAPETEAAMGHSESEEDDLDYATSTASSSDAQEGGEGGAETQPAN